MTASLFSPFGRRTAPDGLLHCIVLAIPHWDCYTERKNNLLLRKCARISDVRLIK